jgi:hypothetical protein
MRAPLLSMEHRRHAVSLGCAGNGCWPRGQSARSTRNVCWREMWGRLFIPPGPIIRACTAKCVFLRREPPA